MSAPEGGCALVTGGSRGIGAAIAERLRADGWNVATLSRNGSTSDVKADVSDSEQVVKAFEEVRERFGPVLVLVNNAGVREDGLAIRMSADEWERVVDVNLNGAFYCLSNAFRLMRQQTPQGGRIINNGSISAHAPRPGSIAYTATKHAVSGLTRTAALDGRAHDIAVGQIDIGNAASEMTDRMVAGVPQADGTLKPEPRMPLKSVSDALLTMANLPADSNVLFMTVMATKMPFVGRG